MDEVQELARAVVNDEEQREADAEVAGMMKFGRRRLKPRLRNPMAPALDSPLPRAPPPRTPLPGHADESPMSPSFKTPPRPEMTRKRSMAPLALQQHRSARTDFRGSSFVAPPQPVRVSGSRPTLFLETSTSPLLREFAKWIHYIQSKPGHPSLSEVRYVVQMANSLYHTQRDRTNVPALIHWVGMVAIKVDPSMRPTPPMISELIVEQPRPVDDETKVRTILTELANTEDLVPRVSNLSGLLAHLSAALSLPVRLDLTDELRRLDPAIAERVKLPAPAHLPEEIARLPEDDELSGLLQQLSI